MGEIEDLQQKNAEMASALEELRSTSDARIKSLEDSIAAMTKEKESILTDLKSARETNAILVSKLPGAPVEKEEVDTRTPEEKTAARYDEMIKGIYDKLKKWHDGVTN